MLKDPKEIEIISKARQPGVASLSRSSAYYPNIEADFFSDVQFNGRYVELGPGQLEFCEIMRAKGGHVVVIDYDPAVVELARHRGYEAHERTFQSLIKDPMPEKFDGVFSKFAWNSFWAKGDRDRHRDLIKIFVDLAKGDAWIWIAPWNRLQDGSKGQSVMGEDGVRSVVKEQEELFVELGFTQHDLTPKQALRYGIKGKVLNNVIYTRNLRWTPGDDA